MARINLGLNAPIQGTTCEPERKEVITRSRAVQLVIIAEKIAREVEKLGVQPHERCYFGSLMGDILQFPTK